jgi:hypothetical protein
MTGFADLRNRGRDACVSRTIPDDVAEFQEYSTVRRGPSRQGSLSVFG